MGVMHGNTTRPARDYGSAVKAIIGWQSSQCLSHIVHQKCSPAALRPEQRRRNAATHIPRSACPRAERLAAALLAADNMPGPREDDYVRNMGAYQYPAPAMGDFALLAWLCAVFNPVVGSSYASAGGTLPSPRFQQRCLQPSWRARNQDLLSGLLLLVFEQSIS